MTYSCRVCGTAIESFMSFGQQPMANAFVADGARDKEFFFELKPAFCESCSLFQLLEVPEPEQMFHGEYPFFTSSSKGMQAHFRLLAQDLQTGFLSENPGPVIEIGCNDGTLLQHFAAMGCKTLGVEPSANVAEVAKRKGLDILPTFFNRDTLGAVRSKIGQASIITAANVFCHIPAINEVFAAVKELLNEQGVLVFEDPYLGDVIAKTSFDQIYDEHVYLFSLEAIRRLCVRHELELFDAAPQVVHGGSMRYYIGHKDKRPPTQRLKELSAYEAKLELDQPAAYAAFKQRCEKVRHDLPALLKQLRSEGKRVIGYAATSKSTTIFNYCGIGPDLLECIVDTTPEKQGKLSPGMHIPVRSMEYFYGSPPEYGLLLAWNHSEEIMRKERDFSAKGGKWITHVPAVNIFSTGESVCAE